MIQNYYYVYYVYNVPFMHDECLNCSPHERIVDHDTSTICLFRCPWFQANVNLLCLQIKAVLLFK